MSACPAATEGKQRWEAPGVGGRERAGGAPDHVRRGEGAGAETPLTWGVTNNESIVTGEQNGQEGKRKSTLSQEGGRARPGGRRKTVLSVISDTVRWWSVTLPSSGNTEVQGRFAWRWSGRALRLSHLKNTYASAFCQVSPKGFQNLEKDGIEQRDL